MHVECYNNQQIQWKEIIIIIKKLHFTSLNYILIYTYHPELSECTITILNYTFVFLFAPFRQLGC